MNKMNFQRMYYSQTYFWHVQLDKHHRLRYLPIQEDSVRLETIQGMGRVLGTGHLPSSGIKVVRQKILIVSKWPQFREPSHRACVRATRVITDTGLDPNGNRCSHANRCSSLPKAQNVNQPYEPASEKMKNRPIIQKTG